MNAVLIDDAFNFSLLCFQAVILIGSSSYLRDLKTFAKRAYELTSSIWMEIRGDDSNKINRNQLLDFEICGAQLSSLSNRSL